MTIKELLLTTFLLSLVGFASLSSNEPTEAVEELSISTSSAPITQMAPPAIMNVPSEADTAAPAGETMFTWQVQGPGEITAPILLYHRVDPNFPLSRYNVPPSQFEAQMKALKDWGYTTITISDLVTAINTGRPLPPRPIVITFDDGNYSVYEYAYPIMQKYGFVGVNYVVLEWLDKAGYIGVSELAEMYAAGWETGSHSYSHSDLHLDHSVAFNEICQSKDDLAASLDQPVNTFAYPFGSFDQYLGDRVIRWEIDAAVGLGNSYAHDQSSLSYLQRIEIKQEYDLEQFAAFLPWSSPAEQSNQTLTYTND